MPRGTYKRFTASERFERAVDRSDPSGCHVWMGTVSNTGYGQFSADKKLWAAHRWAWEQENGPIEGNLFVRHYVCGNRLCVNTAHLRLGSAKENAEDRVRDHSITFPVPTLKLSNDQIAEATKMRKSGRTWRDIGSELGVSRTTAQSAVEKRLGYRVDLNDPNLRNAKRGLGRGRGTLPGFTEKAMTEMMDLREKGLSWTKIGRLFGVAGSTISRSLDRAGVLREPLPTLMTEEMTKKAIELWSKGRSWRSIASELGVANHANVTWAVRKSLG